MRTTEMLRVRGRIGPRILYNDIKMIDYESPYQFTGIEKLYMVFLSKCNTNTQPQNV